MRDKKPWASYRRISGTDECRVFDTYNSLLKEMRAMMHDSMDNIISVTRTRRGEWGQWFERWQLDPDTKKPTIIKQTWL